MDVLTSTVPLNCESPAGGNSSEVPATLRAVVSTAMMRRGLVRPWLCLRVNTIAEVDERQVALRVRQSPGAEGGLARLPARESLSEAEPRWQNRGISGGREALVPGNSAERGGGDSSVEGASGRKSAAMACRRRNGPWCREPSRLWSVRPDGATGSVSDQPTRLVYGPTRSRAGHVRP